jgi:hypothetical protein
MIDYKNDFGAFWERYFDDCDGLHIYFSGPVYLLILGYLVVGLVGASRGSRRNERRVVLLSWVCWMAIGFHWLWLGFALFPESWTKVNYSLDDLEGLTTIVLRMIEGGLFPVVIMLLVNVVIGCVRWLRSTRRKVTWRLVLQLLVTLIFIVNCELLRYTLRLSGNVMPYLASRKLQEMDPGAK